MNFRKATAREIEDSIADTLTYAPKQSFFGSKLCLTENKRHFLIIYNFTWLKIFCLSAMFFLRR